MGAQGGAVACSFEQLYKLPTGTMDEDQSLPLTDDQKDEFTEAFRFYDKDKDDCITSQELGMIVRTLGQNPSKGDLKDMINAHDPDGTGLIHYNAFLTLMAKEMKDEITEEELMEAFSIIDDNSDGLITTTELRHCM